MDEVIGGPCGDGFAIKRAGGNDGGDAAIGDKKTMEEVKATITQLGKSQAVLTAQLDTAMVVLGSVKGGGECETTEGLQMGHSEDERFSRKSSDLPSPKTLEHDKISRERSPFSPKPRHRLGNG